MWRLMCLTRRHQFDVLLQPPQGCFESMILASEQKWLPDEGYVVIKNHILINKLRKREPKTLLQYRSGPSIGIVPANQISADHL